MQVVLQQLSSDVADRVTAEKLEELLQALEVGKNTVEGQN